MYYYYRGVASWSWFYDYHYAPRISGTFCSLQTLVCAYSLRTDFKDLDKMKFDFQLGKPFRPFEQLMGVLPAASKDHIPEAYQVSVSGLWLRDL